MHAGEKTFMHAQQRTKNEISLIAQIDDDGLKQLSTLIDLEVLGLSGCLALKGTLINS